MTPKHEQSQKHNLKVTLSSDHGRLWRPERQHWETRRSLATGRSTIRKKRKSSTAERSTTKVTCI